MNRIHKKEMLAFGVLPDRLTGRKSTIKRTKLDLNPREFENEVVSNSLERKTVAMEIREEKSTNQIPRRNKRRITRHICNRTFVESKVFYMEWSLPVGEKVSPYWNRRNPRIVDWSQAAINQRVQKLRELGIDAVELETLRSRLDSLGADVIEVKGELKSLWESVNQIGCNVELSQSKMMEELHRFMTFVNERYREGRDIQMDYEQTKKTRSEILPIETWGIF
ncbi:hypothetical protein M9H77_25139 [Catharanthus roseus]|uniref:Uncharacterized protein n=1 Tax=Catharanthus roseus TaxID=4058 RepID=A0ACC0A6X8_CATRO|nr:hypothetical protein M9H77_25139 [Catharanthus roseus]